MKKTTVFLMIIMMFVPWQIAFAGDEANPGDIVIIEIMQNPSAVSDANGEWFEIYNNTGSTIDLNGWTIKDNGSESHVISNGGSLNISSGNVLVLGRNNSTGTNGNYTCNYQYSSFQLGNGDDEVILLDNSGDGIDSVYYDGGTDFPDPTGASMTLNVGTTTNLYKLNNVGSNWTTESASTYGDGDSGTPGSIGGDQSLPVELTLFTAVSQKGAVKLSWATESEIDNLGFLIDRSLNPNSDFITIADYRFVPELQGQGSVTYRTGYSYTDKEVVPGTKYYYILSDVTGNPEHGEPVTRHTDKMVSATPKGRDISSALINGFKTFKAYPNPFNPKTVIAYELEDVRELYVSIVDVYGRQVTELYNGFQASGFHEITWQPKDISAGIYFCHLTSGGNTITRKLVLLK